MGPRAHTSWRTLLLIFSAFCLLPQPFGEGQTTFLMPIMNQEAKGSVQVIRVEVWKCCGSVALDPKDDKWSCCGPQYPFHRSSQRCCSPTTDKFLVIPKDDTKSEYDDCSQYKWKY